MRTPFAALTVALLAGCSALGPTTIPRDQFDYGAALASAMHQQLLLNIVKLRYLEAPMFVEVSSVINQYSLEGELGLASSWRPDIMQEGAAVLRFYDRPTITYTPVVGREFTQSLLTPVPPGALLFLIQSGWPVDFVFRSCLQAVNGHFNRGGSRAHGRMAPEPAFDEIINLMMRVQGSGAIGMRVEGAGDSQTAAFVFRRRLDPDIAEDRARLRELLHLAPDAEQFRVTYGADSTSNTEIAMLTRSVFEIMMELCQQVDVPPTHLTEGRAAPAMFNESAEAFRLIRIHSGEEASDNAFVSVSYRDHEFWIDDTDLLSKRTFAFLTILFNLTKTDAKGAVPLLTVTS